MLEKAYGFDVLQTSGTTGAGQTVVIDDACGYPNIATDLSAFDAQFGLSNPTLNVIDVQGSSVCANGGWSVETSLDVEMAHVTAPGATIDLVVAAQPGPGDVYGAWTYSLITILATRYQTASAELAASAPTATRRLVKASVPAKPSRAWMSARY